LFGHLVSIWLVNVENYLSITMGEVLPNLAILIPIKVEILISPLA